MATDDRRDEGLARIAAETALLLTQFAACRAQIGDFARFGRETPQLAARRYAATARLLRSGGLRAV